MAFARGGDSQRAVALYRSLRDAQRPDGSFAPRIAPDGHPPDSRPDQFEAIGWYAWGFTQLLQALAADGHSVWHAQLWEEFGPSIVAAGEQLLAATAAGLPPPSSDYWERQETELTLATAALTLAGLSAIAQLGRELGVLVENESELIAAAAKRSARLREQIIEYFGPSYGRYGHGTAPDAAIAFLLPPFQDRALPGARKAWRESLARQYVPASGGYAPGAGWKDDGISWTPETTLHAWVAAEWAGSHSAESQGERQRAIDILQWIAAHSTAVGAIPEKVGPGGQPAAVAPLAWSAANVVLAIDALSRERK